MNAIRSFLDQLGTTLEARASRGCAPSVRPAPPRELHLELTFRCNTACVMCNLRHLEPGKDELSAAEIQAFVEGSAQLKELSFIVLSGGEPWLRDDFTRILSFLRGRYPSTGILVLSNLADTELALRSIASMEKAVGLRKISLGSSLDGIGAAHDRIRGTAGSFAALERTLAAVRRQFPGLYVSLNFTLTPENCDEILPTFRWCRTNGYHISYQVLVQKKETRQFVWQEAHRRSVEHQLDAVIVELGGAPDEKGLFSLLANEGLLSLLLSLHYIGQYIAAPRRFFPACPCGEKYAMIDPRGNVYFCPVHKTVYAGNVRHRPFDEVWLSAEAARAREFFNRRECHCWLTCTNGYMLEHALKEGKQDFIERFFSQGTGDGKGV